MKADGEKPPVVDAAEPKVEVCAAHQFSLRALLWFVLLCSLWCTQIPLCKSIELTSRGLHFPVSVGGVTSVLLVWAVLPSFCLRRRLYLIFLVHLLTPIVGLCFFLLREGVTETLWEHFAGTVLMTNLICFPGAVITAAWRWLDTPADYVGVARERKK
jgi:hypothetical protein